MVKKSIEETYVKTDLHSHILELPTRYIGGSSLVCDDQFIVDNGNIIKKTIKYVPGLLKIFDEILVNAIDHSVRESSCNSIKVTIENDTISVYNNGPGIPVVIHKEHNIYIPELIFGNLLTSSNYDKNEERIVGGVHGEGSKAANIFSKKFIIDTVDSENGLSYHQEFSNNMYNKTDPKIKKSTKNSFTQITFTPDYNRFGITGLSPDIISLMKKRVYDCTACTNKNVSVYFNGEKLKVKEFLPYTQLYFKECVKAIAYEKIENGPFIWEIAVYNNSNYEQVSFVNGINTIKGGRHVDCVLNQITSKLSDLIMTKKKIENIKSSYIRDHLFLFIRSTVVNPSFDSQTKETLTTHINKFGIKIEVSDAFINKIFKSGIIEEIISFTNFKNNKELSKTVTSTSRKSKLKIEKLEDAHLAGTSRSKECSLLLVEGDSAKTFAISGYSIIGRERYGIYSLRGKVLNTREATVSQLLKNEEINNIKSIMGLQHDKKYKSVDNLRYGSIIILADQDYDGEHIKSLIINVISTWWPELLEIKGFIKYMKTPIIKISKGSNSKEFYTIKDYNNWENSNSSKSWNVKYYKGLGTSTATEAKDLFKRMKTNIVNLISNSPKDTEKHLLLAFDKSFADKRKEWLQQFNSDMILDQADTDISYTDFINKNLIHFSMYDVIRSIPSICDGLKPSQRKVIFTMFKRNYQKEIKVAQLASAVAECSSYHHGEASLMGTIINLAQDYIGGNNWNLLKPNGQFGTTLKGGKDAASPRYIYTELSDHSKKLFDTTDFKILDYIVDEGMSIEPKYYIPILPIILINGTAGIGTGYSTNIPCFNPSDIIANIKRILNNEELVEMIPWYRNFKGKISKKEEGSFIITGVVRKFDENKLKISELPIGLWTEDYKKFLEELTEKNEWNIVDFKNNSTETDIDFELKFQTKESLDKFLSKSKNEIYKILKLVKPLSTRNMHLFDKNGSIKKYNTAEEILTEFLKIRLEFHLKRKDYIIKEYNRDLDILKNKLRFLQEIIDEKLVVYKKSRDLIVKELSKGKYMLIDDSYNYLLNLPIYSFTSEKINELTEKVKSITKDLTVISSKSEKDLYIDDLGKF